MFPIRGGIYFFLSLVQVASCARQFQHPEDLPGVEYDFITIGGGNSGAVVASRLGENSDFKILVIEAGPSNLDVFDSEVPGLSHNIGFGTRVDWNYSITPQIHVNDKVSSYGRAMMLGGCSSHNEMAYTRGSRDDYDRWASVTGDDNLSWNRIHPYILKAEKWSGPNDPNLSEENHFNPSVHGSNGKIGVSAPYYLHPFNDLLFEAAKDLDEEFPFLLDLNDGRPIGIGWGQATIARGFRSSSATGYLAHTGDNVHVLLNTRVTRILPTNHHTNDTHDEKDIDFRQVEFTTGPEGPRFMLKAKKELILSGGMINTPQILLNSGIGPKGDLDALGTQVLIDNLSVGKNFSDQVSITITFSTNLTVTDFNVTDALAEWKQLDTGRLALPQHLSPLGWVRFPATANPFKNNSPDPTGGPNSPHIEFFFGGISSQGDSTGIGNPPPITTTAANGRIADVSSRDTGGTSAGNISFTMIVVDLHPVSRGSIKLASSSAFDAPLIDPNLLDSPLDTSILLEGIRSSHHLFLSSTFSNSIFGSTAPQPSNGILTDKIIIEYIKNNSTPFGHGVGSCSMAPHGATWGVVDPEFKVRGARGLRIVDASVIPFVVSGHTQAATYAIAEWASDVIKRSWE